MIYKQPPSWLAHHGIEGQRWGVKHGPPYPLDSKVSTGKSLKTDAVTAEAIGTGIYFSVVIAEMIGIVAASIYGAHKEKILKEETDAAKANYKRNIEPNLGNDVRDFNEAEHSELKKDNPLVVTDEELRSINAYDPREHTGIQTKKVDTKLLKENLGNGWYRNYSRREIYGRANNCTNCAMAFNLHKSGWLINAAPRYEGRLRTEAFEDYKNIFKGSTRDEAMTKVEFKSILSSKSEGSFGSFSFGYRGSKSGHILNWAIEDGKTYIYDAQNARKYTLDKFIKYYDPSFGDESYIYDVSSATSIDWNALADRKFTY